MDDEEIFGLSMRRSGDRIEAELKTKNASCRAVLGEDGRLEMDGDESCKAVLKGSMARFLTKGQP